jgi:glycosyltransferase involved in cell wall biosynthesis
VKLAYLVTGYPLPSHTFIQQEVLGLRRLGVEVHTFAPKRAAPEHVLTETDREEFASTYYWRPIRPWQHLRAHAAAIVRRRRGYIDAMRRSWSMRGPGLRSKVWHLMYFTQGVVLWHRCALAGVRHIHVHFANSSSDIAIAATVLGGPEWSWSLSMHGPTEFYDVERLRLGTKVENARFTICISDFCRSQVMAFTDPEVWPRMHVVHCGVAADRLQPRARAADDGPVGILCVGRLVPEKGQTLLLDAVARLLRRGGREVRLALVGDGPSREALEARVRELGLTQAVELSGALGHTEVLRRVAEADVFCLPSFAEGVPVSLMEAMALGVPVVSTRVMGIPELIHDGESGILTAPGDLESLILALTSLIDDPELRARLAERGRAAVERGYDLARTIPQLHDVHSTYLGAAA